MKFASVFPVLFLAASLPGAVERIPIPDEGWSLVMDVPELSEKQDRRTADSYAFKANSGRFNLSFFVDPPPSDAGSHEDCLKFYWPQASQNPGIVRDSVTFSQTGDFQRVEYVVTATMEGHMFRQRHVHCNFDFSGRWIDVHVSVIDPTVAVAEILARFDPGLRYERTKCFAS